MRRVLSHVFLSLMVWQAVAWGQAPLSSETYSAEQEKLKIVIAPFTIYSEERLEQLQKEIPRRLIEKIPKEQLELISYPLEKPPISNEMAIECSKDLGAEYVILGSLTKIGKPFSLDITILETGGIRPPFSVYAESSSLEKLSEVLDKVAKEIALKVLRRQKIVKLEVTGNKRVDIEAILAVMKSKEGEIFDPKVIREDIKGIFKMDYFEDIKVDVKETPLGVIIKFMVDEKPVVRIIRIVGNKAIKEENIKEVMALKANTILNVDLIKKSIDQIKTLYQKEGYFDAQVEYKINTLTPKEVEVVFDIKEGAKAFIKKILFKGNKSFKDKKLKKLMKNKEKWLFSFITGSGKLKREDLENDVNRIVAFYYNNGYIRARVGEPKIGRKDREIYITIPIEEGEQYHVNKVDVKGDLVESASKLLKPLKLKKKEVYSRQWLQEDIMKLSEIYADKGFAYAEVTPQVKTDDVMHLADVVYNIKRGIKVHIGRIEIEGNTKTRDKVIRREFWVSEGGSFSKTLLEDSLGNLRRLGYFEDVKVETEPGLSADEMNLKIRVKEQPTGAFSIGGGYSSIENFIVMADISQRNFLGRGQQLTLRGYIGGITKRYTFDFTEPYLFDTRLSTGFQAYKWDIEYMDFTKISSGGEMRLSYPVGHYSRIFSTYRFERAKTTDFATDPETGEPIASRLITELADGISTSSLRLGFRRDTRNRYFYPTKGTILSSSIEFAGGPFQGDSAFTRYETSASIFIPLFWDTVGFIKSTIGYISRRGKGLLPLFERYYLGGPNTLRGYDFAAVGPRDPETDELIGGNKMLLFNLEFRFPIVQSIRLTGMVFLDAGNAFDDDEGFSLTDLRKSVGLGIRWFSPMGPVRIEWGYILERRPDEPSGNWEFGMGTFF